MLPVTTVACCYSGRIGGGRKYVQWNEFRKSWAPFIENPRRCCGWREIMVGLSPGTGRWEDKKKPRKTKQNCPLMGKWAADNICQLAVIEMKLPALFQFLTQTQWKKIDSGLRNKRCFYVQWLSWWGCQMLMWNVTNLEKNVTWGLQVEKKYVPNAKKKKRKKGF